jgi:MFS family permease
MVFSPDVYWLIGFRALSALFTGTVNPAQALLVSNTPKEHHGYVLGVLSTAVWSGHLTGYLLGGVIVEVWGCMTAFLSCSALYFISGLMVQFFVREDFHRPEKKAVGKSRKLSGEILAPGVITLLVMFMLMGAGRRIDQPFVAMLVELVNGEKAAALWTGIISAGGAVGGVIAGFGFGTLSDRYPPRKDDRSRHNHRRAVRRLARDLHQYMVPRTREIFLLFRGRRHAAHAACHAFPSHIP